MRGNTLQPAIPPDIFSAKTPSVMRVALYSLIFNLGLVAAKFFLFTLSASLALRADAVHTLVDVLASIIISFLLFAAAYEIILVAALGEAEPIHYPGLVLYAVAAIIPLPFLFGSFQIRVGKQTGSPSLIADGVQHKADVFTSALVLLALIAQSVSFPLDRIAEAIIALVIAKEGWEILVDGMRVLLDASVDAKTLAELVNGLLAANPG